MGEYNEESEPEHSPLLPIFAADLDSIPVYNLVHEIKAEIERNLDTTLTWEQLKSPQVSSFVVKPILGRLMRMEDKVSKGLIYGLLANCLQFRKEAEEHPGRAGTSNTRALLCELLAIKLLKEFSFRELIDVLSYDFYPLHGTPPVTAASVRKAGSSSQKPSLTVTASRISALEIAIRAQAKKLISHPAVIQHLESIWAGNIVFHSACDQLHHIRGGGCLSPFERRSATIYDGRHASLFNLSRLRIPRYRHLFSTFSLAILLFLHIRVLIERSYAITPLELVFWLWSFGFIIDEIVDFKESGISLYFMSMWNAFDFSIFLLFMAFYVLRIAGLFMPEERDYITDWSFDTLASCSIFLFPRIFSVLDHYRYFSQLVIAFRIMASDMIALLVLIVISCSGFFVAFTFSFARDYSSAKDVSYALFQILMGFTPAAWEVWNHYNLLGKFLLTAFLIICHFLIVTILITVLTNSFAKVAANSVEEHQFLVAVNTISLVKNENIFTYLAPTNLIAWILHPLRYFMSFRQFVRLNRTVVKVTHFPLLAAIYFYESMMMRNSMFAVNSAAGRNASSRSTLTAFKTPTEAVSLLSPAARRTRRRESIASNSQQQERVLEEVFARPYKVKFRSSKGDIDGKGSVIDSWMNNMLASSPPAEVEGFARGHGKITPMRGRCGPSRFGGIRDYGSMAQRMGLPQRDFSMTRAALSDPDVSAGVYKDPLSENDHQEVSSEEEAANNEENSVYEDETNEESAHEIKIKIMTPRITKNSHGYPNVISPSRSDSLHPEEEVGSLPRMLRPNNHERTSSTNTVLFNPIHRSTESSSDKSGRHQRKPEHCTPGGNSLGLRTHKSRPWPITGGGRKHFQSTPDLTAALADDEQLRGISSSFATQMAMATSGPDTVLGKLMLAKISALEVGMQEIREFLGEQQQQQRKGLRESKQ